MAVGLSAESATYTELTIDRHHSVRRAALEIARFPYRRSGSSQQSAQVSPVFGDHACFSEPSWYGTPRAASRGTILGRIDGSAEGSQGPGDLAPIVLVSFLLVYCAALMIYAALAVDWGPLHVDLTEMWAWGKEFALGYEKHPPLAAWIAGSWFSVFPRTNFNFYLLATLNGAVGLLGVWAFAGLFFGALGRWACMLLLVLTPAFTITVLKYNANAPLISLWPWASYFFVRSLCTQQLRPSAVAGLLAAAACLTKYYSIVLVGTYFFVALLYPGRRRYFASWAPYVSIAAGLAACAPHLWWAAATGFPTVEYAVWKTEVAQRGRGILTILLQALGGLSVASGAFAFAFGRETANILKRSLAGMIDPRTAWVGWLSAGPVMLTLLAYLLLDVHLAASYFLPVLYALPVSVFVCSRVSPGPGNVTRLATAVGVVWLLLLLAAPVIGYWQWRNAGKAWLEPRQEIAIAATEKWHALFNARLQFVSGSEDLAKAITFYSSDAPSYRSLDEALERRLRGDDAPLQAHGGLIVCRPKDRDCEASADRYAQAGGQRFSVLFGKPSAAYVFIALPPRTGK